MWHISPTFVQNICTVVNCGNTNLKYFLSELSAQIYTWHSLRIFSFLKFYSNIVLGYTAL